MPPWPFPPPAEGPPSSDQGPEAAAAVAPGRKPLQLCSSCSDSTPTRRSLPRTQVG